MWWWRSWYAIVLCGVDEKEWTIELMKIVFFTMSMSKGGAERVISELCNYGAEHGHDMHIVTCLAGRSEYELRNSIKLHSGTIAVDAYHSMNRLQSLGSFCKQYVSQIQAIQPDVVVSFLPEPCMITEICKPIIRKPIIGSVRSNPYYQYRSKIRRVFANALYPMSDGFVFQTEDARNYFNKRVQAKSIIIGNPVKKMDSVEYSARNCKKEIVSVGRFTYEKNYPLLIKAFQRVHKQKAEYHLKIYGKIDERLGIRKLITSMGLDEYVHLCGQTDHIEQEIHNSAMYVLSSLSEGMPNALIEAMAIGLPVVATDCPSGGPRQLIQDRKNGILVENDNVVALADGMLEVLNNAELAEKLAHNAKKISEEYDRDKICAQWMDYIAHIMKGQV